MQLVCLGAEVGLELGDRQGALLREEGNGKGQAYYESHRAYERLCGQAQAGVASEEGRLLQPHHQHGRDEQQRRRQYEPGNGRVSEGLACCDLARAQRCAWGGVGN